MAITACFTEWNSKTTEDLVITDDHAGITAQSVIRGTAPDFTCQYKVTCDSNWQFKNAEFQNSLGHKLFLRRDFDGNWFNGANKLLKEFEGAYEIDFVLTPFTNTLALKRLQLGRGESADIVTAWIDSPDLSVKPDSQRYTCIEPGRLYRFESLDSDFSADIEFSDDGLVKNYPGLFRRS